MVSQSVSESSKRLPTLRSDERVSRLSLSRVTRGLESVRTGGDEVVEAWEHGVAVDPDASDCVHELVDWAV